MSLSIGNSSEGSEASLDSGTRDHSQISSKPKRVRDQFRAWKLEFSIYHQVSPIIRFLLPDSSMQAQHGKHDDLIAPRRYIGASPRRLGRSPRFSAAAENTAASWFKLSVFGELRLNNGGLLAAGENRKLFRKPLNPLPHPAV